MTTQKSNASPVSNEPISLEIIRQHLKSSLSYRVLEGRIAFDAAMGATAAEVAADNHEANAPDAVASAEPVQPVTAGDVSALAGSLSNSAPAAGGRTVVFVDGAVNDPALLAAAAPHGAEIVMLDGAQDGVTQIASYLAGKSGFDAIHIVSHGDAGLLQLGSSYLTLESISGEHSDEMAIVRAALSDDADILVYGCDVSSGLRGQSFVQALSAATGADVAASSDDTGSARRGGDWDLETRLGLIEAGLIDAPEWNGLLAPLTISTTAVPATSGATGMDGNIGIFIPSGGVGYTAVWTNAGTIGSTIIDVRATVTSLSASSVSFYTIGDDPSVILNGPATATIKWEIFAADATHSLTIVAVGSPNFQIADIDGVGGVPNTRETVRPQLNGLTSYTVDNPTNLVTTVSASGVQVSGTQNQANEPTSLTRFTWQDVSTWSVDYIFAAGSGFSNAVSRHDGDGDFTFTAPVTVNLLALDLDSNNSTIAGTGYQNTFTENGAAVSIVDPDIAITQHSVLGTDLHKATVRLTNTQTNDVLLVNGNDAFKSLKDPVGQNAFT